MAIRIKFHFVPVLALLLAGCNSVSGEKQASERTPGNATKTPVSPTPEAPKNRVSDRPGNTKGAVFIVEYHHIGNGNGTMFRTADQFRNDLETYYKLGFRPCTLSQYLDDKMDLAPGASPMVFTFDDANPDQFRLNPDGSLDPSCALGIWQDFAKQHPDFPIKATFFVLPVMWGQPDMVDKKVAMLRDWGCELGNHTIHHFILRKKSDEVVRQEIAEASDHLEAMGVSMPPSLALPYGSTPKNASLTHGFSYKGKEYKLKACLLVGAEPAPSTESPRFNPYRLPRVQACAGDSGIDDWLGRLQKGQVHPYVQP